MENAWRILDDAMAQADRSVPVIRVTARMHIARVLTAFDQREARTLLSAALEELKDVELSARDRELAQYSAHMLAAAVAPELAARLGPLEGHLRWHSGFQFVRTMLDHGHKDAAWEYMMQADLEADFPQEVVALVLHHSTDAGKKLALLRRSIQAWRQRRRNPGPHHDNFMFVGMFGRNWVLLPEEEAQGVVRELVADILTEEDITMQGSFDPEKRAEFTSKRQHDLFQLLHILRRLDPALADSLVEGHPELASAAAVFPMGMESVMEASAKRSAGQCGTGGGGYVIGGSATDMPFLHAWVEGKQTGNFDAAFDLAMVTCQDDIESNGAILECWPSTAQFRMLLYAATQSIGTDASKYLDRIPDPDVRLYAQIEMAAALAGLVEFGSIRSSRPRAGRRNPQSRR